MEKHENPVGMRDICLFAAGVIFSFASASPSKQNRYRPLDAEPIDSARRKPWLPDGSCELQLKFSRKRKVDKLIGRVIIINGSIIE